MPAGVDLDAADREAIDEVTVRARANHRRDFEAYAEPDGTDVGFFTDR